MRVTTKDLQTFAFCPYLHSRGGTEIVPPLTIFEQNIRKSIMSAERRAMNKNSHVNPRKIGYFWEKYWWDAAAKIGLTPREIDKYCYPATLKFIDYCKYDISSELYDIAGVDIPSQVALNKGILDARIDVIKRSRKDGQVILIDFSRTAMTRATMANDIDILATIYAFSEFGLDMKYFCVDLSESIQKVKIDACFFSVEEARKMGSTINYLSDGIHRQLNYKSYWQCEWCNKCSR
jgi:hypothetical protein